jgi:sulfate adenylyltransferase
MIAPHGGTLIDRSLGLGADSAKLLRLAKRLPKLTLTAREINDLELIGNGALSPLTGFMQSADYRSVISDMRLAGGLPWTLPVTLAAERDELPQEGRSCGLYDQTGELRAIMEVAEVFPYQKPVEAQLVYGTDETAHPGVAALYQRKEFLVGGPVRVLPRERDPLSMTPAETRAAFAQRGWKNIVGFQTRNPVHRAHEYIQKCALEAVDGLLLHPLVGETKSDDVPADVRLQCYKVLLEHYYPADRVVFSTLPAAMRYAGPREAIFHAIMRKNFGCTHFIVGRDHAGVGKYYGTYDAQKLFDLFKPDELGITPLKFENSFYCRRCEGMASRKTCSHDEAFHVSLSGTAVRTMLREGKMPPPEFSRPEVARVLIEAMSEKPVAVSGQKAVVGSL